MFELKLVTGNTIKPIEEHSQQSHVSNSDSQSQNDDVQQIQENGKANVKGDKQQKMKEYHNLNKSDLEHQEQNVNNEIIRYEKQSSEAKKEFEGKENAVERPRSISIDSSSTKRQDNFVDSRHKSLSPHAKRSSVNSHSEKSSDDSDQEEGECINSFKKKAISIFSHSYSLVYTLFFRCRTAYSNTSSRNVHFSCRKSQSKCNRRRFVIGIIIS